MQFGLTMPPFGAFADPRYLAETAQLAERAGWDGFFIWDHAIFHGTDYAIPATWVALAAVAMQTERIRLGAMITPLARRRPWNLAREAVSVNLLANGRLIFGVGLGSPAEGDFGMFGEEESDRIRAQKLDESLDILHGLWSGQPFSYDGQHYHLKEMAFQPVPPQRIPVWVGGGWDKPKPMQRAARYDGFFPLKWLDRITPDEWRGIITQVNGYRDDPAAPYDWIHADVSTGEDAELIQAYAEAGVTWWVEDINPWRYGWELGTPWHPDMTAQMVERIRQGPPQG